MAIRYLILALTTQCNLQCRYCYYGKMSVPATMSEAVMGRAFSMAGSSGQSFHLQLTGGEPTLVPALIERAALLAKATDRCSSIGIQTNGTCLTPDLLAIFKKYDIQVGVSLDGPPAVHQHQRGKSAETLRGLQQLEAAGIAFRTTTVVTQHNAAVLDRLVLMLAGFSHARGIGLDLVVRKGRAKRDTHSELPDRHILKEGIKNMLTMLDSINSRRFRPIRLRERDLLMSNKKAPVFCHVCRAESMAVHPDGRIYPCGQTLGDSAFGTGTVWQPEFECRTPLETIGLENKQCGSCRFKGRCPGECPSRLYYNQAKGGSLACELYRAIVPPLINH